MSLRLMLALAMFAVALIMTLRRPFWGVITVVVLYHLRLEIYGAGLDDIRFQFFATIALIVSFLIHRKKFRDEPEGLSVFPLTLLFLFTGFLFLTSFWAVHSSSLAYEGAIDFLKVAIFSWFLFKIVRTEKDFKCLLWTLLGASWYVSVVGFWGTEFDFIDIDEMGISNHGTDLHFTLFLPLLFLLILKGKSKYERIAAFLIIPSFLLYYTATDTGYRSAVLMVCSAVLVFLLFVPMKMKLQASVPLAIAAALYIFVLAPPGYWHYMKSIVQPTSESSASSRFIINEASREIFYDYPQGVGFDNYSWVSPDYLPERYLTKDGRRNAHNTYLNILCETGPVGFILWLSVFVMSWRGFHKVRRIAESDSELHLWAFGFEMGLLSIALGIATHDRNMVDTLYWFVAFSVILMRLVLLQKSSKKPDGNEVKPQA